MCDAHMLGVKRVRGRCVSIKGIRFSLGLFIVRALDTTVATQTRYGVRVTRF